MSNSSPRSVTPLVLEPGSSRWVRQIILSGFLLALFSVVVLPLPPLLLAALCLLLIGAFRGVWKGQHVLSGHPVRVRLDSDGLWYWQQGEHDEPIQLSGNSYHVPFLAILNFRPFGKKRPLRTLMFTTDNIDPATFRRLRIHLNWQERTTDELRS